MNNKCIICKTEFSNKAGMVEVDRINQGWLFGLLPPMGNWEMSLLICTECDTTLKTVVAETISKIRK